MSALDRIYRLQAHLGEFHQQINDQIGSNFHQEADQKSSIEYLTKLEKILDSLSIKSKTQPVRPIDKLVDLLSNFRHDLTVLEDQGSNLDPYVYELLWLVAAKASTQTLAIIWTTLSENLLSVNDEIRYWDGILEFDWYIGLYILQTSPLRLWRGLLKAGLFAISPQTHEDNSNTGENTFIPVSTLWVQFYTSVQRCIYPSGLSSFRPGIFSPLVRSKLEIQRKRRYLKSRRDFNASSIGLLMEECMCLGPKTSLADGKDPVLANCTLHRIVSKSVCLMTSILQYGSNDEVLELTKAFTADNDLGSYVNKNKGKAALKDVQDVVEQLLYILNDLLPKYQRFSTKAISEIGRPPITVRYWLPLSLAFLSAGTSFTLLKSLGPALVDWVVNAGSTAFEFWTNWVVEPTWRLIRTIRHDETSEIALMSKNSLEADRASLERMVVDFVLDRGGKREPLLSANTIADKVREGDLTPVLMAYEKDLRSPFIGTVRGDLVRALLIQIQKTKVDVEIAMSGIDALLKSQELVFGFVGLTPGILVSYAFIRWFWGLLGSRKGFQVGRRQNDLRYALRNIHRILTLSVPTANGLLTYRNHGLLISNADTLLRKAEIVLKGEDFYTFQEDIGDLINENRADLQLKIIERMTWTYSKWT
ncbi:hypothetical protein ARAM_003696 [Aspergillus rambellii]|uniref:Uncharacterized protein n=1 Tax=Aspergillus rambellii TaxID=308745 RepID=A0A0F8X4C4_9EURO|nr:hypothetical protein ARAM_003696 [Aspergillus rambellii]